MRMFFNCLQESISLTKQYEQYYEWIKMLKAFMFDDEMRE